MSIDELKTSLLVNFHDADIYSINIDYVKGKINFTMGVFYRAKDEEKDKKRQGELQLTGLLYCVIEPPDNNSFPKEYHFCEDKLIIASDSSDFSLLNRYPKLPDPIPDNGFRHWFYVVSHNSFIYVAAMDAQFEWRDS